MSQLRVSRSCRGNIGQLEKRCRMQYAWMGVTASNMGFATGVSKAQNLERNKIARTTHKH
jgi:hypothetical protein